MSLPLGHLQNYYNSTRSSKGNRITEDNLIPGRGIQRPF